MGLHFTSHGSVVGITPLSQAGAAWLDENTQADSWQWMGATLYVEWRYAELIAWGAHEDGLRTN